MTSLGLVLLSATFLPSLWAEPGSGTSIDLDKRFSINMMDPLRRRSALDKNFVRFGRSGGGVNQNREVRARQDNFIRFGRSDEDEEELDETPSLRDARSKGDFIRFGRSRNDINSGFMRLGRGKSDRILRFGRARPENFIRFGKSSDGYSELTPNENDFHRTSRGISKASEFVRYGKRDPENDEEIVNAYKNSLNYNTEPWRNDQLVRLTRLSMKNKDGFIRFGRTQGFNDEYPKPITNSLKELSVFGNKLQNIPVRGDEDQIYSNVNSNPDIDSAKTLPSSESYNPYETSIHEINRKKRSLSINDIKPPLSTGSPDFTNYYNYPSQLAAGLPNFIIGPELSVLPAHSLSSPNSGKKIDEKNVIRLG